MSAAALVAAADPSLNLKTYVDAVDLDANSNPIKEAYWTGLPHHRRTPFAVSPDGKTGFVAYLDASGSGVHVQHVDPSAFTATGTAVTVDAVQEAGGLVAHNDGFALLANEPIATTVENAPPSGTPVPAIYRYTNGEQTFKTFVAGPGVHEEAGLSMSPDMNGDLVWSDEAELYGAYFVVTDYTGDAEGHFGDSIQYINSNGTLETIDGASSSWGCSHNTSIAFEAAEKAPFASICTEDQGAIWLNTNGQGMHSTGVKVSNENTTNGAGGEAMGGMSGSYSGLARFANSSSYIFAWVSRGAVDLAENAWMGEGYTNCQNRTNGRRVAIALFSDKETKVSAQASSEVGAADGDSQVNCFTPTEGPDRSNAHVAVFDDQYALVTWEQIDEPSCDFIAMGCSGTLSGSYFQLVDSSGSKIGNPVVSNNTYFAGDMVTMNDGSICWPYVNMEWSLDAPSGWGGESTAANVTKMSFACMSLQ
ncbi:uncharacterized protein MYCFIDRAFT_77746 [Pseudocercospora fijiensis CIRAD86]|uniref:Uncharacterized protein n=1 Tax=Pseudocercospora fijiensis (strain CIRAD86) TaxID=383855 RepID=M2ZSD1_PSEFD|nr:uncharacterized protein MYCFIDRAFT_77746 [Pseudocercospora fijiensis CIRAD86]EME81929.1 hypothetical protein MYCFIDRAFT_77746 [Pseudocercospora fijiensis CIRAD86]